jgi:hypothetical protein
VHVGQPPAEADIQRPFRVSPPTVHQMIVTLERNGFIRRQPGVPRNIAILYLFVTFDPHCGWRNVKVTERRAAADYAHCMRELVDVHYPDAACIRVVQDNRSIHTAGALYQAFAPADVRRILRRFEFHYTPKHASWLNMAECEISVLQRQCLGRRIDNPQRPRKEIAAWQRHRNKARDRIKWMFTTDKARATATAKESKSL